MPLPSFVPALSDPIVAPNGAYAFAAKVSGAPAKANGVWTNLGGTLHLALCQDSVVPSLMTEKLASVTNGRAGRQRRVYARVLRPCCAGRFLLA